jgi:tripartite-type tricarboxylate transporter receptor subunit TctC
VLQRKDGLAATAIAAVVTLALTVLPAVGQGEIFAGKTVQIIVGFGSGGGYDHWARTLARHIGRHLPGRPAVVTQNMPGAGSLNAANHLYSVAPKDGTAIGIIARDAILAPLTGQKGARFDATKFSWIGSPTLETNVCVVYHTAPVQTFADLLRRELIVGATGLGSGGAVYPRALNALLGTKFKLITGFASSSDVFLAMERGEIEGSCDSLDSIIGRRPDWISSRKAAVLLQGGTEPDPHLKGVPFVLDLARNDEERQTIRLLYAGQGFGRPFLAPPDLPPQRLRMLRDAFDATMRDAEFADDVRRQKLDLAPKSGAALAALVQSIYDTPKPIVEKVTDLMR